MTDYKGLIERARKYVHAGGAHVFTPGRSTLEFEKRHLLTDLSDALESTLARLQAAEKVCEAVENMRDVSLDLKTALGLEHKVHEALDAWREAKSS